MKVLFIETVWGNGGIPKIIDNTMELLLNSGDEAIFAYGRQNAVIPPEKQNQMHMIGNKSNVYLHYLKSFLLDRSGFGSRSATKKLIKWIDEYQPDVIHLHSLVGYYINVEVLFHYLKRSQIPVVWTFHDCWAFTGHCTHFETYGCDKWRTECEKCGQLRQYPKCIGLDQSKRNFREKRELFLSVPNMTIVTPSLWLAELARKSFVKDMDIRVIPNGIDMTRFCYIDSDIRERYGLGNKKILLGVASRWTKSKGYDIMLELSEKLNRREYQVVMVGVNQQQKDEIGDRVLAISRTRNVQELAEWYSVAYLFINPTFADNFPTVNLEALACGTPVITFETGGSAESIDDITGVVLHEKTSDSLTAAVVNFDDKKATRENCILRSKQFDYRTTLSRYIDIYREKTEQGEAAKHEKG